MAWGSDVMTPPTPYHQDLRRDSASAEMHLNSLKQPEIFPIPGFWEF